MSASIVNDQDIRIKLVETVEELQGIRDLQEANLSGKISAEEAAREGFVTASYTMDFLKAMHEAHPSVIAKHGDRVVGYALVATQDVRHGHPLLEDLFDKLDLIVLEGVPVKDRNYVVVGQLCVAKSHRALGLVQRMYGFYREQLSNTYDCCLADIVQANVRSLRAHARTGFKVIGYLEFGGRGWDVVMWDWRQMIEDR
jgi:hypothetical protein